MKTANYKDLTNLGRSRAVILNLRCPHCDAEAFLASDPTVPVYGACLNDHKFAVVTNIE